MVTGFLCCSNLSIGPSCCSLVARSSVDVWRYGWWWARQPPQQLLQHKELQELRVFLCVGMTHVEPQQLDSDVWLRPHRLPVLHANTLRHKVAS